MNTNPYRFQYIEEEKYSKVRETEFNINAFILSYYRLFFVLLACAAYIAYFAFDSLYTARILAIVAGLMSTFDIFLLIILSKYYSDEK